MKDHLRLFRHTIAHTFDGAGRATRAEFLTYVVLSQLPLILATWLAPDAFEAGVRLAAVILTMIPLPALTVRRLHDFAAGGRWSLLLLVPVIRVLALDLLTLTAGGEARSMIEGALSYIDWLLFLPCTALYLLLLAAPGTAGANRFGPGPRGGQGGSDTATADPEISGPAA